MTRWTKTLAGLALAAAMLGVARVQPPADRPPPPGQEPQPRTETREQLQARLQARLERIRADEERITRAIAALEAGKPVEDEAVRGGIDAGRGRQGRGDGRFGGPGPGGGGGGGRPGGDGERPNGPGGPPIDRERTMEFIRANMPEIHERLATLRANDAPAFDRFMGAIERRVHDIMTERDPEMRAARVAEYRHGARVFEASRRLGELIRRSAPEAELNAARENLRPLLAEQFDLRLKVRQLEVVQLEHRLEKLRAEVEGQSANRDKAVEDGLARIEKFAKERPERPPPPDR